MGSYNVSESDLQKLARFFYVFSDGTRLRIILSLLDRKSRCVNNVAQTLGLNQPTVSQQLRILKDAGLVKVERDKQFFRYSLADEHVEQLIRIGLEHIAEQKGVLA